jgi:hypothetical protein
MGEGAKMYYTEIGRREDLDVLLVQLERYSSMADPVRGNIDIWEFPFYLAFDSCGLRYYHYRKKRPGRSYFQLSATQFLNKAKAMFPKTEPAKDGFCGEEEEECCGNCRFWELGKNSGVAFEGFCRVDARGPYDKDSGQWCGQWKEKNEFI